MKSKKLLVFLFYTTLSMALVSCNNNSVDEPPPNDDKIINEIIEIPEDTPVIKQEVLYKNRLTGLEISDNLVNQRPVAVMFNNLKASLPQVGISSFDILYEITTEGAITRLMGVATDWASLPTIGSVRSSRDYFIDISDAHDAVYVHAGGSTYAYTELWARGTDRIDGTNGTSVAQSAFYRDKERMKTMSLEHTLLTNGENLKTAIEKSKFNTTYKDGFKTPLTFAEEDYDIDGESAEYVYIPFSYYAQSYLTYDNEKKTYSKGQHLGKKNTLDMVDSPHIDGLTGDALEFKNVVILYAEHSGALDDKGRISVNFTGSGEGYYVANGECIAVRWEKESRSSSYTLYKENSNDELLLMPGKTYIAIVPMNCDVVYK